MQHLASSEGGGLHIEHRRLLHRCAQDTNGLLNKGAPEGVLVHRRYVGVAERMVELTAAYDAIRPDTRGNRIQTGR